MFRNSRRLNLLSLLVVALVSGCASHNVVDIKYEAPAGVMSTGASPPSAVSVGGFADQRGTGSTWVGAIRGGYGNRLKNLTTRNPTSEVVQSAFSDALKARNILAPPGNAPFRVEGTINKFDCSYFWNREAHAHLTVRVVTADTRNTVFSQSYRTDNVEAGVGAGIFGDVDHLARFAQRTLNETIDKALSDPALLSALSKAPPAAVKQVPLAERLRSLEKLKRDGLISESEYDVKRQEVLKSL